MLVGKSESSVWIWKCLQWSRGLLRSFVLVLHPSYFVFLDISAGLRRKFNWSKSEKTFDIVL